MDNRVVTAIFNEGEKSVTASSPLYQYDYGQEIEIIGLELPEVFEVHFSNDQYGTAVTQLGNNNRVVIPDTCLESPTDLYAWIFLHDTEDDGETEYQIYIPIIARAEIGNPAPTPEQADIISQAIATLNEAVTDCNNAVADYPEIINDYWWVYNPETNEKENSGVKAKGEDGNANIDDTTTSSESVWSSAKTAEEINAVIALIPSDIEETLFPNT